MARELLGQGWRFPITVGGDGRIAEASAEDKVRQAIETILRTARGERVMRPDFGCGVHDLVYDTASDELIGRVQVEVAEALARWEPRITVVGVAARQDPDEPTRLLVEVDYRIRSTNSRFNLVFPFYLQ